MTLASKADLIRAIFAAYHANDRSSVEGGAVGRFPLHQSLRRRHRQGDLFREVLEEHRLDRAPRARTDCRRRRSGLRHLQLPGEGRQELPQHRIFRLRRRQGARASMSISARPISTAPSRRKRGKSHVRRRVGFQRPRSSCQVQVDFGSMEMQGSVAIGGLSRARSKPSTRCDGRSCRATAACRAWSRS